MGAVKKTNTKLSDVNLASSKNTFIYVGRKTNARGLLFDWKHKYQLQWNKYQIKETDMRVKTASFTTNQYLDLTTGVYTVLITSPAHEDFGGTILSVEYDSSTDLYTYQCQDFSRNYQSKFELIVHDRTIHQILKFLITRGAISLNGNSKKKLKKYKKVLSGLRPAWQYGIGIWNNSKATSNFMTLKPRMIMRNVSYIEAIKDIVFGFAGSYVDVYFDKYGVLHVEPYLIKEWLNTGLYLTMPEIASYKNKFDTTNVITNVIVHNTDNTKGGTAYSSENLVKLDLSAFFGNLTASIENPNQAKTKTKVSKKKSKTKKKDSNPYGTKSKTVYLNSDSIDGYSADMGRMQEMKGLLEKEGWSVTITGVGSEAHYERRGDVKDGIWFCLYGGACAGTLREHCTSDWFLNPLKSNHSRVAVGFFPPSGDIRKGGKYFSHLGPAHDWGGNQAYANIDYPGKFMSENGIPWMYADNAKEMVAKFLAGGDNFSTSGSSYDNYDSWQKHNPNWL